MTVLHTPRLRLRPLAITDAPRMAELLAGDSAAIQMTERIEDPCTLDAAERWLTLRTSPGDHSFAIELASRPEMIGTIGYLPHEGTAYMGYWVGRAYWGQGYATEAGVAVLADAASHGVREVVAEVLVANPGSARVLEKLGFERTGVADQETRGRLQPTASYLRRL